MDEKNLQKIVELLKEQNTLLGELIEEQEIHDVSVIDVDMSIVAMIVFLFKWVIASIPVGIVLGLIWWLLFTFFF